MRLIDADAFSAFIKKAVAEQGYEVLRICDTLTVADVLNSVCAELDGTGLEGFKNAPTVDAVPVVRCAVCRYFRCNMRGDGTLPNGVDEFECVLGRGGYDPMDFCSEGERKDGEHDRG